MLLCYVQSCCLWAFVYRTLAINFQLPFWCKLFCMTGIPVTYSMHQMLLFGTVWHSHLRQQNPHKWRFNKKCWKWSAPSNVLQLSAWYIGNIFCLQFGTLAIDSASSLQLLLTVKNTKHTHTHLCIITVDAEHYQHSVNQQCAEYPAVTLYIIANISYAAVKST